MCGLAGCFQPKGFDFEAQRTAVQRMADSLVHRGPDDAGIWLDGEVGVSLAHRRLSVIDLSPSGHQPMASGSGRYVIVFNGGRYITI